MYPIEMRERKSGEKVTVYTIDVNASGTATAVYWSNELAKKTGLGWKRAAVSKLIPVDFVIPIEKKKEEGEGEQCTMDILPE